MKSISLFKTVAVCSVVALVTGCSFDQTAVLDHPSQVSPGQQFDVALYNQLVHVTTGGTIIQNVVRDSIHVAVGMPAGWNAVSAKSYVASNFKLVDLLSKLKDTVALALAIRDSSIVYKSRATAMTADGNYPALLAGRSYEAADRYNDNEISVATDSITTWRAYRGAANILLTAGTSVDTFTVDTATGDTTGISAVPVFVWVTLQAKSTVGLDTLYYFTKTAAMPALTDSLNIDMGDMVYVPLPVGTINVLSGRTVSGTRDLSIRSSPGAGFVSIDLGALRPQTTGLGVYSLTGSLVADLSPLLRTSGGPIAWQPGNTTGMYILRCKTNAGAVSQTFKMVR